MKRLIIGLLIAVLAFSGCSSARQADPYRVDTVVHIPVDPTDAPTEEPTDATTEPPTEAPIEAPTDAPTEPKETTSKKTTSSASSSSGKGSTSSGKSSTSSGKGSSSSSKGSSSSSSKNNSTSKKEPAATQPPKATEPPATAAPETLPPETVPPTEKAAEPPYNPASYGVGGLEYAIVGELNASRVDAELSELSLDGYLSGIAYLRAKEASSSWSHTRPDGRSYKSALSDYGYGYGAAAELMVYVAGSGDAASITAKWMNSESHRENILSGSFSTAGIGVYNAGGMTYVVCLLIG